MKVKKDYHVTQYGSEVGELMNYVNKKRKDTMEEDFKVLYKRMYSWLKAGILAPQDTADIDHYVRQICLAFNRQYPTQAIGQFRIERKSKDKAYMTLDNIVFVPKGGRK